MNQTIGTTPPSVNHTPPTARSQVKVWNGALRMNSCERAYHKP